LPTPRARRFSLRELALLRLFLAQGSHQRSPVNSLHPLMLLMLKQPKKIRRIQTPTVLLRAARRVVMKEILLPKSKHRRPIYG